MSLRKGKVAGDRGESCWRRRVQQRREKGVKKKGEERVLYALKRGGKNRVQQRRETGKKNREKTESREFYML